MKTFVKYSTTKIATQYVAGILIDNNGGRILKREWLKIEKDKYGKSLIDAGFLIKVKEFKQ